MYIKIKYRSDVSGKFSIMVSGKVESYMNKYKVVSWPVEQFFCLVAIACELLV